MLNKYLDRLESLLDEYRNEELVQFEGPNGKRPEFDDLIWYHVDPNTYRKTRYLCGRQGAARGKGLAGNKPELALRYPYSHLIKVWIIETTNAALSASEKQARVSCARKLLTEMDGDLYVQTANTITGLYLGIRVVDRLRPFIGFCASRGLMRDIAIKNQDDRDRTGHAVFDIKAAKLPKIESLLALGSIFTTVFHPVNVDGMVRDEEQVKIIDAWVATYALLGLASPNRLSAEVPVLPKQRLKRYAEGGGEPVFYLDWKGSKGFTDNKNHVLAALADKVEKAINFFYVACEPARILCRFYENQKQPLEAILGDFKVASERQRHLRFDEAPTLFALGYALGFYGVEDCVQVLKSGVDPSAAYQSRRGHFFEAKPIHALTSSDRLSTSSVLSSKVSSLPYLFGYTNLPKQLLEGAFPSMLTASVGEVQDWWISYYTSSILPTFPLAYSTGESSIKLADALFCFLGAWGYDPKGKGTRAGGKPMQRTFFAVSPLSHLGVLAATKLSGNNSQQSTFEEYGFSPELCVRPHSLRHFGNTLAELSEIPIEIITAWSGRRDPEQTNTYIHSSHEERADRVRTVINRPENDKREIRVIAQEGLAQITNLPATITSTGVCTQDLYVTPCNYLNDFVSQCFLCPEACHIAGDVKAIELLEKDHSFQASRLEAVSNDWRLPTSRAMQEWYVIHSRNVFILSGLINLMKTCKDGSVIRYSGKTGEFHLTDLNTKAISKIQRGIPDFESALKVLIEKQSTAATPHANPQLRSLLSSFGLSEEVG